MRKDTLHKTVAAHSNVCLSQRRNDEAPESKKAKAGHTEIGSSKCKGSQPRRPAHQAQQCIRRECRAHGDGDKGWEEIPTLVLYKGTVIEDISKDDEC